MTISDLEKPTSGQISVVFSDIDLCIVNSLRRIITSEIPNIGFYFNSQEHYAPDINILKNDTPLHNEIIQHRICLIPICVSDQELDSWDKNQYTFKIHENIDSCFEITTKHIKVYDTTTQTERNDLRDRWFPPCNITKDYISITQFTKKENAEFKLEAKAIRNVPNTHASFGMVSQCSHEFIIDELLAKNELIKLTESVKDEEEKQLIVDTFKTLDIEKCYHKNKYGEVSKIKFTVCSECSISPQSIIERGLNILLYKFRFIHSNQSYDIENNNNLMTILIKNEKDTLGNCFQALVFNHFIRESNMFQDMKLTYIGYNIPHPLENILIIKMKANNMESIHKTQLFLNHALEICINSITDVINEWNTFSIQYKL